MGEANDDTLPSESGSDDTLVAATSEPGATPPPRIRPSRPSIAPGAPDYPQLTVVDPAHYVIGRELARGGMGRIQVARDRRLGREVAVKEVLVAAGSVARRFEREARITARLQHPSIISVHEAGTWPSGEPFYAMRLVTGRTLDEALAAAKTYPERLALLPNVLAIADAMAYAHGQKIVHRDLKPRNVVVGEFGETVVIDWGLAKELGSPEDSLSGASQPPAVAPSESSGGETTLGEVLGTPAYMPPEQANGETVDERADVYAIGSILYHVLAGRPPYVADTNAELIAALHAAPPRPLVEVVPEIAPELVAIVERAMARDRDGRYPTARELAEDLRRFQTGQLVGAHRYSLRQLVRRWMRRHRTALAAAVAAVVVAGGIGVVAVRRVVAAEADAQRERASAIEHGNDAEALMTFMLLDLREKLADVGKLDLLEAVAGRAITYYDAHGATASEKDAYLAGIAQLTIGVVTAARGKLADALTAFAAARARLAKLAGEHPDVPAYRARQIEAARGEAGVRTEQGDRAAALAIYREDLPLAEASLAAHPDDGDALLSAMRAHADIGGDLETRGELLDALAEYRIALALAERRAKVATSRHVQKDVSIGHSRVGRLLAKAKHDLPGALAEYRAGLAISESTLAREPKNPFALQDVALSHSEVGRTLAAQKQGAEALAEYRLGAEAIHQAVGVDPSNTEMISSRATLEEKVGIALFDQGDYAGALAQFRICEAIWADLTQRDPTNTDWMRGRSVIANKLGDVLLEQKNPAAAIAAYRIGLEIREALVAKDPANSDWRRDLFYSHFKLASAYNRIPDPPQIVAEFSAAATVADGTLAAHPTNESFARDASQIHSNLGNVLTMLKKPDDAKPHFQIASDIAHRMIAQPGSDPEWKQLAAGYDARLR